LNRSGDREHHRETDGVDPHPAVALGVAAVEAVDGVDDLVDRLAGELVAKDIDRDLLVGGGEGADGAGDALDRARVAEDVPGAEALDDDLPPAGGVGDPLAGVPSSPSRAASSTEKMVTMLGWSRAARASASR
jgi:hypothetical protein